jgi:hypothetical protein
MLNRNGDRRELLQMALFGHEFRLANIQGSGKLRVKLRPLWGASRDQSDEEDVKSKRRAI